MEHAVEHSCGTARGTLREAERARVRLRARQVATETETLTGERVSGRGRKKKCDCACVTEENAENLRRLERVPCDKGQRCERGALGKRAS